MAERVTEPVRLVVLGRDGTLHSWGGGLIGVYDLACDYGCRMLAVALGVAEQGRWRIELV